MLKQLEILYHHGTQCISDLTKAVIPTPFRGRPQISEAAVNSESLVRICPTNAISTGPLSIDLGKCVFCGECALKFPEKISFTNDYRIASNDRSQLIITEGNKESIRIVPELIRPEIRKLFKNSIKLRQVSAGGDNSCELELNACGNPNFDMNRFGIEFVASPRHADGLVITGPISSNMANALRICYEAIPSPKLVILCGTDAISGGIFYGSPALDRSFLEEVYIDLFVPGNPSHPLTIINGLLDLTRSFKEKTYVP